MIRFSLPALFLLISPSLGCSYSCPEGDYQPCIDNEQGIVGADCSGFLGCTNQTQPCAGECPPEFPVISKDGLSCNACDEDGEVCPDCKEGEFWCQVEGLCKPSSALCGGKCGSKRRPVQDPIDKQCYSCSQNKRWCVEDGKCYNPSTEPCNGECQQWGARYCAETKSCVEDDIPCSSGPNQGKQKLAATQPQQSRDLCSKKVATIVNTFNGSSYVFNGDNYHLVGNSVDSGPRKISEDWPGLPGNIDAALTWKTVNDTYFFKGDQYWRFTGQSPHQGYPKSLSNWPGLPSNMDAAMEWGKNEQFSYFFKSANYLLFDPVTEDVRVTPQAADLDPGQWWFGRLREWSGSVWIPMAGY
eukprot:TRINITY_DN2921_c0_g1_i4.p1 TRINITY_DN2921_c0_g1~~TRINITY_DN2921_c0_g1_i4.p1  ORF type:complete len:357 (-),score=75.37 TRINITY_DN2921_c0_g1_i4:64-1134(-)